jgi:hypothetical protein
MTSKATKQSVPVFFLIIGVVCLVAATVGGRLVLGLVMLGIMAVCSVILILLGRRSETYRSLTEKPDERSTSIVGGAWAGTGVVLTVANLGGFIGDLASGGNGAPFYWMLATAAIAYIAFIAFLGRHS